MSANFTLNLENPQVSSSKKNVIYIDAEGGNSLDLVLGNNSGMDVMIGGENSQNQVLKLFISDNILTKDQAHSIAVSQPWHLSTLGQDNGHFNFALTPPDTGILLKNGQSIIIQLTDLEPSQKAIGQIALQYTLDDLGDQIKVAAEVIVQAEDKKDGDALFGIDHPLNYSFIVNQGGEASPIIATVDKITPNNSIENRLQVSINYQPGTGALYPDSWNPDGSPLTPSPSFKVFFPYFSAASSQAALLDLTDSFTQKEKGYNAWTSAWNIKCSLDADNPDVLQNEFWEIKAPDQHKDPLPVWEIVPRSLKKNPELFTSIIGGKNPGPVLDLFFSHIYTNLPVSPNHPESLIYFQWTNFPGFNEGIITKLLRKKVLQIKCFTGKICRNEYGEASVFLEWETEGAQHCLVDGDASIHPPITKGGHAFPDKISTQFPAKNSYTLTAVGNDGTNPIQISAVAELTYKEVDRIPLGFPPAKAPNPSQSNGFALSKDGKRLFTTSVNDHSVSYFDPINLPTGIPNKFPVGLSPSMLKLSPDGKRMYVLNKGKGDGTGCSVSYFDPTAPPTAPPAMPAQMYSTDLALSKDGSIIYISSWAANEVIYTPTANMGPNFPQTYIEVGQVPILMTLVPRTHTILVYNRMDNTISYFDANNPLPKGQKPPTFQAGDPQSGDVASALILAPDGKHMYMGFNALMYVDVSQIPPTQAATIIDTGFQQKRLHSSNIHFDFVPNREHLVVVDQKGKILFYKNNGQPDENPKELLFPNEVLSGSTFLPDGSRMFVSLIEKKEVLVLDAVYEKV